MISEDRELRRAFLRTLGESKPLPGDPSSETIWSAARGELSPAELEEVLDRVATSPACAESWMIAQRILDAERQAGGFGEAAGPISGDEPRRASSWIPMAVAATILLAVFVVVLLEARRGEPVYRGAPGRVESLLPDDAVLPRDEAVLRWRPGPEGTRYRLRVLRADFRPVLVEEELTETSYEIPEASLQEVPDGEVLQWQVEAMRPDGETVMSEPFHFRVEGREEGPGSERD